MTDIIIPFKYCMAAILVHVIGVPAVNVPAANILMQMQQALREMNHRMRGIEMVSAATPQTGLQLPPKTFPLTSLAAFLELESKLENPEFYDAVVSVNT